MRIAPIALAMAVGATAAAVTARADVLKGPYVQDVTPTGITVMWHAEPPVAGRVIVEGPGLPPGGQSIAVAATAVPKTVVTGLHPATRYRYRVEIGAARDHGEFATAPEVGSLARFSFIAYGDNGLSPERHRQIVDRAAADIPDFIVGLGDAVDDGRRLDEWQNLFAVERPLLRDNVMFPALGNHDRQARGASVENFRTFFSLPGSPLGVTDSATRYYAFTYGSARFLILDSNAGSFALTDQTAWLERELIAVREDPRLHHIFVAMHHPPYSISLHGGSRNLRELWTPLFEKYGVTAVLSGHDHVYERAEANGIHYFVSGGGGAVPYKLGQKITAIDRAAVKRFERVNHYLRVTVDGDQIEVAAILADGTLLDTTVWGEPPRPAVIPPRVAAIGAQQHVAVAPLVVATAGAPQSAAEGIGVLGVAGAGAALLAALVLVLALRRDPARS